MADFNEFRFKRALNHGPQLDSFFFVPDHPKKRVLDVGSGMGDRVSIPLALRGHDVTATEFDASTRGLLRKLSRHYKAKLKIVELDFDAIRFPRQKYDCIFARYSLHFHHSFDHLKNTLRELQSHTSVGGEHRFALLTDQVIIEVDKPPRIPNLSSNNCKSYLNILKSTYQSWNMTVDILKGMRGIVYFDEFPLQSTYNAVLFSTKCC